MRPFRLLIYTDAPEFAGAERALATVLGELDRAADVTVVGVDEGVVGAIAAARPGAETRVVPAVRDKFDHAAVRAHIRAVRAIRPDVFQANLRTSWSCQYGVFAALRCRGAALISWEHAPLDIDSAVQRRLKRLLARRHAAHVASSEFSAVRVAAAAGLSRADVRVIRCGVTDCPVPPEHDGTFTIAGIGRLVREKGFDLLIRALPSVPQATVVLVGDGPERAVLGRLAAELGVGDRVGFRGWTDTVRSELGAFDVVVAPSRFEALGLSLIEAMLSERAVVGTRVGGIPEVIDDGLTGLLVPPDDPDSLAAAISRLAADPTLRRSLGGRARIVALERFSPARAARGFEALYEEVLP